jgi:TAG lipase/steryl ester hydrolase/phospholipase A2/LPA acyltransferase
LFAGAVVCVVFNGRVLSGTSGGSIAAAMVACKTDAEMSTVIHPLVSTDYRRDGAQAEGIRWFPPLRDQLRHFLRHRVLMDSGEFKRCCDWYYGDCTFAEVTFDRWPFDR